MAEPQIAFKDRPFFIYLQCYFVSIATILGTGILGLPVTLSHCGFYPFLVTIIIGLLMQSLVVFYFTDLLQKSQAVQYEALKEYGKEQSNEALYSLMENEYNEKDDIAIEVRATDGSVLEDIAGHVILPSADALKTPNLHMLADFFLGSWMKYAFNILLLLCLASIQISYALAGGQTYAQILSVKTIYVLPVFTWLLAFLVIFGLKFVQPLVSIMTLVKGTVLIITVCVTFIPGSYIQNEIHNDFSYVAQPFLMGTVSIGGIWFSMPMMYTKIKSKPSQVRNYRRAVLAGLATCTLLNILWCWAVLKVVPQNDNMCLATVKNNNTSNNQPFACMANISLESAGSQGLVSTVPLTNIIRLYYPQYKWIAALIELFIIISVTVSFLIVAAVIHHTLSGWVESYWNGDRFALYQAQVHIDTKSLCQRCDKTTCCSVTASLLVFVVVFTVAMVNPQGFEIVLELFTSLTLNLSVGLFIFLMIRKANSLQGYGYLSIPVPLHPVYHYLLFCLPLYFGIALGYDIYKTIHKATS